MHRCSVTPDEAAALFVLNVYETGANVEQGSV